MLRFLLPTVLLVALSSCSRKKNEDRGGIPEIPSHLRGGGAASRVGKDAPPDRVIDAGVDPASLSASEGGVVGLPLEQDIMFLDPDDFEGSEAAMKTLFVGKKEDWFVSHTLAKNEALNESKPLLIVFTDTPSAQSGGSPASASLERELLARHDFSDWAGEHFVRLKLDFNVKDRKSADSSKQSLALKKEKYLESLKKRYKVKGFPTVLVISTDGSLIQNVRGYRSGNSEHVWGLLKTAVVLNDKRQESFEEKLSQKGYRHWQGQNKKRILARLSSYRDGELTLIAPNGRRFQTQESSLSADDREWIEQEKEKRKR